MLHFAHIIEQIDQNKTENQWVAGEDKIITLKEMVDGFLPHFKLHLKEIEELI